MINVRLDEKAVKTVQKVVGGGGGSTIVDALPAEGVEGSTYLLRKKIPPLEFKLVTSIQIDRYTSDFDRIIVSNDGSIVAKLEQLIEQKVGNIDEDIHKNFSFYGYQLMSVEDYQELVSQEGVAIIHSEEDLANLEPELTFFMYEQDIKIENLGFIEHYSDFSSSQYYLRLVDYIDDIVNKYYVEESDREFKISRRRIVLNEFNKYVFTEWESISSQIQIIETITDMIEPLAYFDDKEYGEGVNIALTPEVEIYTYTQYVFDKGVYTEVSSTTSSSEDYVELDTEISGTEGELSASDIDKLNNGAKIKLTIPTFYVTSGLIISSGQHNETYEFICSLARKSENDEAVYISADHSYVVTVNMQSGSYSVIYGDLEHYITVLVMNEGSSPSFQFTCRCDDRQVYTKEDLARYLYEKGFIYNQEVSEDKFTALSDNYLPIVSNTKDTNYDCIWYGIAVDGSDLILIGASYYLSSDEMRIETVVSSGEVENAMIVHLMDVGYKM